jgi:hypothetical protein
VLILVSSILLAVDDPLTEYSSDVTEALYFIDITITTIFIIEALSKIISVGLIMNGP